MKCHCLRIQRLPNSGRDNARRVRVMSIQPGKCRNALGTLGIKRTTFLLAVWVVLIEPFLWWFDVALALSEVTAMSF